MVTSKKKKVAAELSHTLTGISDYKELWQVFQATIAKLFPIDWLGIYSAPSQGTAFNVTSNPHLPFNWDELYQKVAPYDTFCQSILKLPIGVPLTQAEVHNPHSEIERECLEYVVRYTDTHHMMGMTAVNNELGLSMIGLYRCDPGHRFTEDEKQMFSHLGPLLGYASQQMLLHQKHDFQRMAYDRLFESEKIRPVFLDFRLRIIDLPFYTLEFLRRMFNQPLLENLPSDINTFIACKIAPNGRLETNTGPWRWRIKAVQGDMLCRAHIMTTENRPPILILRFEEHGCPEDFSMLKNLGLTVRERETLSFLPLGYTNRQIAMAMEITEDGVKKHMKAISRKLGAQGRAEILYQALQLKKDLG